MHKLFRNYLEDAEGNSEFVIVVNLDIRGFSAFSQKVESPDSAMFIKRVYMRLIDEYFSFASYFKSTGDGLLITIPYNEGDLKRIAQKTINTCLRAVEKFEVFCKDDQMINFETPRKIGIGISRGTACRLTSNKKILDYSGRILNLSSRLMDLARPSGIVFDSLFGVDLLNDKQRQLFEKDKVYLRGVAESIPIEIYYTRKYTQISPMYKKILDEPTYEEHKDIKTLKAIRDLGTAFVYELPSKPRDPSDIKITVRYPLIINGKVRRGYSSIDHFTKFNYKCDIGKPKIIANFSTLAVDLSKIGIKDNWKLHITISYSI
jgi:class 3 adenylate cyclase